MFHAQTIWLIGASEGIGAALAERLAREAATLVLSARQAEKLEALKMRLAGQGHRILPMDVTDERSVEAAWQSFGTTPPDMVIYNAGAYEPLSAKQFDLARTELMLDVNFRGALRMLAHVLPAMQARRSGHLVLVASVAAYRGLPKAIGYGASKAALLHLAENLRTDLEDTGICVQVVNPGFVKTRLTDKNDFSMPFLITPAQAAAEIVHGLQQGGFDIHFPKRFTLLMKLLRILPYRAYFWVLRHLL